MQVLYKFCVIFDIYYFNLLVKVIVDVFFKDEVLWIGSKVGIMKQVGLIRLLWELYNIGFMRSFKFKRVLNKD